MTAKQTFLNLPAEKRRRITAVAVKEFSVNGYDGASINRMISRLQIAKGSIFQYFGDKSGLFMYVFNVAMDMVKSYLRDVRDASAQEVLFSRLNRTLTAGITFVHDHPRIYALYLRIQFDRTTPFRDEILSSLRKNSHRYLRSLLKDAHKRDELRPGVDLDQAAFLLDAVMDRFLQSLSMEHFDAGLGLFRMDRDQARAWARELVAVVLNGIAGALKMADTQKGDILIASAVPGEMAGLRKRITGFVSQHMGAQEIVCGRIGRRAVRLAVTGPASANTVHGLTVAVAAGKPALILQIGCCGGFGQAGVATGDIVVASKEIDVQLGLEADNPDNAVAALPFPVIRKSGIKIFNGYPVEGKESDRAVKTFEKAFSGSGVNVFSGPFITVSTITASTDRARRLYHQHGALAENMEGAGAAHVAALYGIPFMEIRAVSNLVGDRDKTRWNLPLSFERCADAVLLYLEARRST